MRDISGRALTMHVSLCVCANKCRSFSFLRKYFEQIKICFVPREFSYNLTSAIRFTKLGQISARMPLSLSLVHTRARSLSVSLALLNLVFYVELGPEI